MNKCILLLSYVLGFFFCLCSFQPKSTIRFDYKSAEAMLKVIQAIHDQTSEVIIEKFLDQALQMEAYQISEERYTNPNLSKINLELFNFNRYKSIEIL